MQAIVPLACFLSMIRPPGVQYENALLQIAPVDKSKCPFVKNGNDIGFQLFTRHNPTEYQELVMGDDEKLFASNINFGDPTVFYFHAFMEQPDDGSGIMVREAYMQRGDTNVIMIDAHHLEAGPWYFTAAQNTWYIGRFAAQFIDYMVSRGLNLNSTHLIGHSLGAQAAGVAGAALTSGRVARITGLDPALPLFSHLPLEQRLDTSDADFVDVIHTDAGIFGYKVPVGHVDFYPNGGQSPQPGCELEVVIPQQLLLNKCDGTEKTQGFYTYYLTTDANYEHSTEKNDGKDKNINENHSQEYKNVDSRNQNGIPMTTMRDHDELKEDINDKVNQTKIHKVQISQTETNPNKISQNASIEDNVGEFREENIHQTHTQVETLSHKENNVNNFSLNTIIEELKLTETPEEELENNLETGNIKNTAKKTRKPDKVTDTLETKIKHKMNKAEPKREPKHNAKDKIDQILDSLATINENIKYRSTENKIEQIIGSLYSATQPKTTPIRESFQRHKRQKRFLNFFKGDTSANDDNFVFKALNFLIKNRKNILPVFSVVREINTLVKSQNGELSQVTKEANNFIGGSTPVLTPLSYSLELGNESRVKAFVKKLLGLSPAGDRLTISGGGK